MEQAKGKEIRTHKLILVEDNYADADLFRALFAGRDDFRYVLETFSGLAETMTSLEELGSDKFAKVK